VDFAYLPRGHAVSQATALAGLKGEVTMTDFEFLKGRFQMFFGFILAMIWAGLEIASAVSSHIGQPSAEFTGFIIGINCIFIGANSNGTAKTFQYLKEYLSARQLVNAEMDAQRLTYRIEKDKAKQHR